MNADLPDDGSLVILPQKKYNITRLSLFTCVLLIVMLTSAISRDDSSNLLIGTSRQFFFDTVIIESVHNLTRRVHQPVKMSSPVLQKDKPWEHITYFTCNTWNVIFDPIDKMFKCWYEDWVINDQSDFLKAKRLHDPAFTPSRYLFAISKDGIHWQKPELGIQFENRQNTNIILGDKDFGTVHAAFIFLDPITKSPNDRFKMICDNRTTNERCFRLMSSEGGIHWNRWDDKPVFGAMGQNLSDVITVAVDLESRKYLSNNRHPRQGKVADPDPAYEALPRTFFRPVYPNNPFLRNMRRIFRSESADFIHWSTPELLLAPDHELDNWDDAFYGFVQYETGGIWVGFLNVLHMTEDIMDVQLCYSRNGRDFKRVKPGTPWLTRGDRSSWDPFMVNMPNAPVEIGDELYIFYGGSSNHHDWWIRGQREGLDVPEAKDLSLVNYALGLAKMKKDRYVSLTALDVRAGVLVTKPFRTSGGRLIINACCHDGGTIEVELTDKRGNVLSGFEHENCVVFQGDKIAYEVKWKNKADIPDDFIKLRFYIQNAELYTFQFVD